MSFELSLPPFLAHITTKGIGEFPAGLFHPLLIPAHVLNIVALALLLGRRTPLKVKARLTAFAISLAAGLLIATIPFAHRLPTFLPLVLGMAMISAAVVASAKELPAPWQAVLFATAGLVLGLDSGIDQTATGLALTKIFSGIFLSFVISVFNFAFYLSLLPARKWSETALRIVASWILAIGLLMMAFYIRPIVR